MRDKELNFFKTYKNAVVCKNDEWLDRLYNHLDNDQEYIMLEGSQGADLSLNHSGNYPYVTSRNISTSQLLADSGISSERLLQTIMVFRPFPIRISNVTPSENYVYSGNYGNGAELTWTQINLALSIGGYPFQNDLNEYNVSINPEVIWKLANECPPKYLKQLFGINYNGKNINEITLIESLELERLVNKAKGITTYKSLIINDTIID